MRAKSWLLASCASLTVFAAAPAWAQEPATAEQDEPTELEGIIVEVERRSQSLQDVPLAVSAFSDTTRENLGIITIQDMAQFTPGFSYDTSTDRPSIRGIARLSNTFSIESPVANYWDGVYTSSVQDAGRRPIFIERTEILRGPQGALSGRGSIAGAVNTISKRPRDFFEVELGLIAASYDRGGIEGTITGPINDWLSYRVNGGKYIQQEGYFRNVALRNTAGDQPNNRFIMDFMLEGQPTDNFEFFIKAAFADYDESRRSTGDFAPVQAGNSFCDPTWSGGLVPIASWGLFAPGAVPTNSSQCARSTARFGGATGFQALNNNFDPMGVVLGDTPRVDDEGFAGNSRVYENPVFATGDMRTFAHDYHPVQELNDHHNYTANAIWHGPGVDVKWIGGHQNYWYQQSSDADGTAVVSMRLAPVISNTTGAAGPIRTVFPGGINVYEEEREWYSNEVNFASTAEDSRLWWIVGLYHSYEDYQQQPQNFIYPGYGELSTPLNQYNFSAEPRNQVFGRAQYGQLFGVNDSKAIYGQMEWEFSSKLKAHVGLRYNKDTKDVREQVRFISNSFVGGANAANPISLDVTATSTTGFALAPVGFTPPAGFYTIDVSAVAPLQTGAPFTGCPSGQFRMVTGARFCDAAGDLTNAVVTNGVVGLPTTDPVTGNRIRLLEDEWQAVTGSLGFNYEPNEDTLFYGRYAKGYRPGGFNAGFLSLVPDIEEESVDSYEVGTKFTLGGSVQLNAAAFRYDYENIQLPLPTFERCLDPGDFSTCITVNSFINLPSAINQGVELEGLWFPTDNLQLTFSYGYLDAYIKEGLPANRPGFLNGADPAAILPTANPVGTIPCGVPSATCVGGLQIDATTGLPQRFQDISGNPLQNSPRHKAALSASYTFNFAPGDLTFSGSYIWRDEAVTNLFGSTNDVTPEYEQVNLRAIWRDSDDKYQAILYVQNLFDEDIVESGGVVARAIGPNPSVATPNPANRVYYRNYNLAPPRVIGFEFKRRFR